MIKIVSLNKCKFEILLNGDTYLGLGKIFIGDTLVRSGRLPIDLKSETFTGLKLKRLRFIDVEENAEVIKINLIGEWIAQPIRSMRDHSFDPIHDVSDWDDETVLKENNFSVIIENGEYNNSGYSFDGFTYHYEFNGDVDVFYLLERASWELDGDINGATAYSQSACSSPVAKFTEDKFWTTEGELFFLDPEVEFNRTMTHNLPRWADHQWFDYQFKQGKTLIALFEKVDLIRTILRRDSGKAELKSFDKYIFDVTTSFATDKKSILLNTNEKTITEENNLWTWIFDDTSEKAREEFGLKEIPPQLTAGHHYWRNATIDTYYKDVLPAVAAVGAREIFAENFKRSDEYVSDRLKAGNMCTCHDYVICEEMGGMEKFKEYIKRSKALGVKNYMWTNPLMSLNADININHREVNNPDNNWYVNLEDTRSFSGGAYTAVGLTINFKNKNAWNYFVDTHLAICKESGLEGYYLDSFYNLFFMPVTYSGGRPQTIWRECLSAMKALEDEGVEFSIESFGPFGQVGHGHHEEYNIENIALCYTIGLGNGSVTVPVPGMERVDNTSHDVGFIYYQLAHKVPVGIPLFIDGQRIDKVYTKEHKNIFDCYSNLLYTEMYKRFMQEDNNSVIYHNKTGDKAYIWNFIQRDIVIEGEITDVMTGEKLIKAEKYILLPHHTYMIESGKELITKL